VPLEHYVVAEADVIGIILILIYILYLKKLLHVLQFRHVHAPCASQACKSKNEEWQSRAPSRRRIILFVRRVGRRCAAHLDNLNSVVIYLVELGTKSMTPVLVEEKSTSAGIQLYRPNNWEPNGLYIRYKYTKRGLNIKHGIMALAVRFMDKWNIVNIVVIRIGK
jgi:hypothetical protein